MFSTTIFLKIWNEFTAGHRDKQIIKIVEAERVPCKHTKMYLYGFGNHHESEALPDSLPIGQNSPQNCPLNLYAEQINGTAFTAPRASNLRTWMYRTRPSVCHRPFKSYKKLLSGPFVHTPNQLRWSPLSSQNEDCDFVDGLKLVAGAGSPLERSGLNVYLYAFTRPMNRSAFYNSDGDFLIGKCILEFLFSSI